MSSAVYTKIQIACEYLDLAMNLFLNDQNLFCAIHLAAAAEELFGMHLPEEKNSHTRLRKAHQAFEIFERCKMPTDKEANYFINRTKNSVKHMNRSTGGVDDSDDRQITINPAEEAEWLIERALSNFYKLGLSKSPTLWKYEEQTTQILQQQHGSIF